MAANSHGLAIVLARFFYTAAGLLAIGWAISVLPVFWPEATLTQASARIIAGEEYKPEIMQSLEASLESGQFRAPRSALLTKAAVIRVRVLEKALAGRDQKEISEKANALAQALRQALTNAPSDPYQWMVLFWLENTRNGIRPENLRYLQMSYALGPNEGWIAFRRNRIALAVYPTLPADLRSKAVSEFVGLVRSPLYSEAADIVAGPGWPVRDMLLARIQELKEPDRLPILKLLYDKNLEGLNIPGGDQQRRRPWQN